ncbi:exported hypothetical protein [Burkholderiales bacterium]|nr:exported hypothetical protein [Burkholderiales bacterium]
MADHQRRLTILLLFAAALSCLWIRRLSLIGRAVAVNNQIAADNPSSLSVPCASEGRPRLTRRRLRPCRQRI